MMEFYSYFVGDWKLIDLGSGQQGLMTIKPGKCGTCHLVEYELGEVKRTELWGCDPASGQWACLGFGQDGERFTQTMLDAPANQKPEPGDRWIDRHEGVLPSGEATEAKLTFGIESADAYTVTVTDVKVGDQAGGELQMRCVRI